MKQDQRESEGEEEESKTYMEVEDIQSQKLAISPQTPPRRPSSPKGNSNAHALVGDLESLTLPKNTTKFVTTATQSDEEIIEAVDRRMTTSVNQGPPLTNGTLTHSILDMQSFSPPRVLLQSSKVGNHESVNGNIFLSQFHHKTYYPSAAATEDQPIRKGYAIDLVSEKSSPGDEIQLQSPQRAKRSNNRTGAATKSLQIRVPSGRSPKRQSQFNNTEIFDVVGYQFQSQQMEEEKSPPAPPPVSEENSNKTYPIPTRSNSAPRKRISTPTPRKSNGSLISVPSKSKINVHSRDTRQVHPFPKSAATQSQVVSSNPRSRSAPPRNQQTRKEMNLGKQVQQQTSSSRPSSSRFSSPAPRASTPRATRKTATGTSDHQTKKTIQKENMKARKKKEEISLSLNSDYPVWK